MKRVVLVVLAIGVRLAAQSAEPTPRSLAPIDLIGYWVSIVNED